MSGRPREPGILPKANPHWWGAAAGGAVLLEKNHVKIDPPDPRRTPAARLVNGRRGEVGYVYRCLTVPPLRLNRTVGDRFYSNGRRSIWGPTLLETALVIGEN